MNNEVWKDIEGYEGLYQVSNLGRVKSIGYKKERILKPAKVGRGYLKVNLCKNSEKKQFLVHRLICQTFIHNPYNLPEVNRRDEDKTNNRVENLEWCDRKYNNNFGTRNQRVAEKMTNGKLSKTVLQFTLDGKLVGEWKSTRDIQRNLGYSQGNISSCCTGRYNSANGFVWRYK